MVVIDENKEDEDENHSHVEKIIELDNNTFEFNEINILETPNDPNVKRSFTFEESYIDNLSGSVIRKSS